MASTSEPELSLFKQEKGFVDDLVITYPNNKKKENYQIKDIKEVAWSAFTDNFQMQYILDIDYHGYKESWTNALLAQKNQYIKLSEKIPKIIQQHTKCVYFPNDESLSLLILNHEPLKNGLANLSKKKDDLSHYETIFTQILGQWSVSETGLVTDILKKSKENARPDLFVSNSSLVFNKKALEVLDKIQDLTYSLDDDELHVCCKGFNFTLASSQLGNVKQCEVLLNKQQPKTVIDLIEIWKALPKACE